MNGLQGMRAHITRRLEDNSQKLVFAFHLVGADSVLFLPLTVNTRLPGLRAQYPISLLEMQGCHSWLYVGSQACTASAFTSRPSGELEQ